MQDLPARQIQGLGAFFAGRPRPMGSVPRTQQIDIDIVDIAPDVLVGAKGQHHLVRAAFTSCLPEATIC